MANTDKVEEVTSFLDRGPLASELANRYQDLKSSRDTWEGQKRELREYIFATDTTTTSNKTLPWKNSTTRPKLCQIRDNLHANYMAALFPNDDWLKWEGADEEDVTKDKVDAIEGYMKNKIDNSGFRTTVSNLVYDFIDYGNAFGDIIFVDETRKDPTTGEVVSGYRGPKLQRVSPFDIVFDITASEFELTPKFTREIVTLGELRKRATKYPELAYQSEAVDKVFDVRRQHSSSFDSVEIDKNAGFLIDGFGSITQYYDSGFVELITFEGDLYDIYDDKLYENYKITIVDRSYILAKKPLESWDGKSYKKHVGWRLRPDNIMAMGPLDNLVGMQYRIDHLENLKADMFDLLAHPPIVIKGYAEDFEWEPFTRIHTDPESSVETLKIDSTALTADFQIDRLEQEMEEMAGAPKQAMGIRTPGEKTAYEVQTLENAAGRIFQNKVSYFEERFLEPLLNTMLEVSRRNIESFDLIKIQNELGAAEFMKLSKDDITAKGLIKARGARHFAQRAQLVQELTNFANSAIGQDPGVASHISGLKVAELFEDILGLKKYDLVRKNIRVEEEFERQNVINAAQETLGQIDSEGLGDEVEPQPGFPVGQAPLV